MLSIGWPITAIFMVTLSAAMAEFGSAYPYNGAMFTWVWKLCRGSTIFKPWARFLSWVTGSFLLCGHILSQILLTFQFATALQGTIIVFHPAFIHTKWTTVGIAWVRYFKTCPLKLIRALYRPRYWSLQPSPPSLSVAPLIYGRPFVRPYQKFLFGADGVASAGNLGRFLAASHLSGHLAG